MSRESLVFLLGLIIFIAPLAGVPPMWKEYLMTLVGALLIIIGFSLRRSAYRQKISRGNGEIGTDSFVESLPPDTEDHPDLFDQEIDTK